MVPVAGPRTFFDQEPSDSPMLDLQQRYEVSPRRPKYYDRAAAS
jgi:hypothetical protein